MEKAGAETKGRRWSLRRVDASLLPPPPLSTKLPRARLDLKGFTCAELLCRAASRVMVSVEDDRFLLVAPPRCSLHTLEDARVPYVPGFHPWRNNGEGKRKSDVGDARRRRSQSPRDGRSCRRTEKPRKASGGNARTRRMNVGDRDGHSVILRLLQSIILYRKLVIPTELFSPNLFS